MIQNVIVRYNNNNPKNVNIMCFHPPELNRIVRENAISRKYDHFSGDLIENHSRGDVG